MKFGNESQIGLIAEEVGGAVGAAPPDTQIELFNALVDGCRDAVEVGSLDQKVCPLILLLYRMQQIAYNCGPKKKTACNFCIVRIPWLLQSNKFMSHSSLGSYVGFFWSPCEGK